MSVEFPKSLWADTAQPVNPSPVLTESIEADVAIVGAGYTGLRAALELAESGKSVAVVDAQDVGWGASGRNGGQVNPLPTFNGPTEMEKIVGATYAKRIAKVALNCADALFSLISKYNIQCDARQNGWLRVSHCEQAAKHAQQIANAWNEVGGDLQLLEGEDVFARLGSRAYKHATYSPSAGAIHPLSLARGLAGAARKVGVNIYGQSPVIDLQQLEDHWRVRSTRGEIRAKWVILATNGYTDGLYSNLHRTVVPITPVQIATEPLPDDLIKSILPGGETFADTRRVIAYGRREPDGRFLIGGHGHKKLDGTIGGFAWIRGDVERIFPQLKGVKWQYQWSGRIAVTSDRVPHFHEPAPRLIAGLGYNGRGVAMSHAMGLILAQRVLGADIKDLPFPATPIKAYPMHRFHSIGARTVVWWMKQQDRRELRAG